MTGPIALATFAFLLVALAGCVPPREGPPNIAIDADAGFNHGHDVVDVPDGSRPDTDSPDAEQPDTDIPDGDRPDVGPGEELPIVPAEVLQVGSGGYLLRGIVLTPEGVLDPGEVLIEGAFITCVATDCSAEPGANSVTWIDTHGIISPGLIDGHNHLAYNFLPEWSPDPFRLFNNRYEWADEEAYEEFVRPYAKYRSNNSHYCPAAKWGELRSLVHGTTTVQGQSAQRTCVNWGVRNADHYHGLGHNHMRTMIGSPRDVTDAQAESFITSFEQENNPVTRLAVHMTEGVEGNHLHTEFASFAGRDPRTNRHQGISLLHNGTAILIHSMILTDEEIAEVYYTNSKIVWSPSSNFALYGVTAPIQKFLETGIVTGIGPDWTVSGEPDILGEMRTALAYARDKNIEILTPKKIWEMATMDGAIVVGLEEHLGRIEVGYRADISVFSRRGPDPYEALISSNTDAIRLVLLDGKGLYGDLNLQNVTGLNEFCEPFDACGVQKFICVQESLSASDGKNERLDDIRTQLYNILEGIGFPEDEQYGRGDELLELALCDK